MKEAFLVMAFMALIAGLMFSAGSDYQIIVEQNETYCEMVAQWKSELHLPADQRTGWPDYKNNYEEVCK